ncbi:MAG: lysozyme inhibitor LprI family protein, partial [Syntrophales bacterium]|nr:lysozyme inhibitor LprI family protein [Syntrophales bacterium]
MTRIYKLAMASCDAPGKEKLRKAQRAWIKYRDSCCEAEASLFEGGTMYGLVYTNCMIDLTIERTKRLRVYDPENSWK